MNMDMWDINSHLTAQTSTWCRSATVSGSEFLSNIRGRQSNPGLRRWQSMYNLAPKSPSRSRWSPSSGAELRAGRDGHNFYEVEQWLWDAHQRLETQLDQMRTRDMKLSYNAAMTPGMFDMKLKDAADLFQVNMSPDHKELHEKVLKLENDLLQMRSALEKRSNDQATKPFRKHEKQKADIAQHEVGVALKEAETRTTTHEDERNKALENLQMSEETEDLFNNALKVQLNRTSQTPQKYKLHDPSTNSESQNNQNQETEQINLEVEALTEVNDELRKEAELMQRSLDTSQHHLQGLKEERITNSEQNVETERSQLNKEKEELLGKMNLCGHETEDKCCQYRKCADVLEEENQRLQDQCLGLEALVQEKEKLLHLQEEEHKKQEETRVRCIEELKAVASHWTEKWQDVALSLQSTQNQLEELKKNNEKEVDPEQKQELLQEKSRTLNQLLHTCDKARTVDRETLTDLSESCWTDEHSSDCCNQHKTQEWMQLSEVQRFKQKLAEKEKELSEREHALRSLERLREMEKTEAQIRISALELQLVKKASEDRRDDNGSLADISAPGLESVHLDECRRKDDLLAVQKHQTLRQQLDKDEKLSVGGRNDKQIGSVNPDIEQQRIRITEQLKILFKEREEKEAGNAADTHAAQTEVSSSQDWTPTSSFVRAGWDRRTWQQSSGLMPVLEEDEGDGDEDVTKGSHAEQHLSLICRLVLQQATNQRRPSLPVSCETHPGSRRSVSDQFCWDECDLTAEEHVSFICRMIKMKRKESLKAPE